MHHLLVRSADSLIESKYGWVAIAVSAGCCSMDFSSVRWERRVDVLLIKSYTTVQRRARISYFCLRRDSAIPMLRPVVAVALTLGRGELSLAVVLVRWVEMDAK